MPLPHETNGRSRIDWTVFLAACGFILALLTAVVLAVFQITDLKIELAKRDARILILEIQKEGRKYVTPDD